MTDAGFMKRFASLEECVQFLDGEQPCVSKFGEVVRIRDGETKTRLILDSKESGVTSCARKNQRIVLPTVNDLVFDVLDIMAKHHEVEGFVMDIKDAFWALPLARQERRFFVGKLRNMFFCFLRLAPGSRARGPPWGMLWADAGLRKGMLRASVCLQEEMH